MADNTTTTQQAQEPAADTAQQEATFTQADVDGMIQKRLERERKKYPGEEEMKAFRAWKEGQQTEKERWDTLTGERDAANAALSAAQAELEQYKRERFLVSQGVAAEDADFYAFKIGKLVTDTLPFEKAAEQYLKEHKPKEKEQEAGMTVDLTAPLGGGKPAGMSLKDYINQSLRGK